MGLIADAVVPEPLLEACALRLSSLRAGMQGKGIEALHVTNSVDVVWLTGTHGHDTSALVLPDALVLISDRRYEEYLAPWEASGRFKVELAPRTGQLEIILRTLGAASIATLGIQAGHVTLARQRALFAACSAGDLSSYEDLEDVDPKRVPCRVFVDGCSTWTQLPFSACNEHGAPATVGEALGPCVRRALSINDVRRATAVCHGVELPWDCVLVDAWRALRCGDHFLYVAVRLQA